MVNATTSDGNSSDTTNKGGKMEKNYKDDGSSTRMNRLKKIKMDCMRFKTTQSRSTTTMNKYPQVGNTGVDAVQESCPHMVYIMKEL
jgi:hypothetical protein